MFKCYVVREVTWQNVRYKQSFLQVQGHMLLPCSPPRAHFRMCICTVAGELCKLARLMGPEFPHPGPSLQSDAACQRQAGACLPGSRQDQKIKRSRGGRWSWTFNSPEEIMSREVELGCESWTSFASSCSSTAVQQTLSL